MTMKDILDLIRTILQGAVVLGGAVWGYYTFVRSRTFKLRLDPTVSGTVRIENNSSYVKVSSTLKNIGICKVDVSQTGSAVTVSSHIPKVAPGEIDVVTWQRLETLPVFEKHANLEPGETIGDEVLIAVPTAAGQVFKLELRLVSNGIAWNAVSVVDPAQTENKGE